MQLDRLAFFHIPRLLLVLIIPLLLTVPAHASESGITRLSDAVATPPDQLAARDYYGLNFIQPFEPWLSIGRDSGAGIVRWQFNWRDAEVSPGVYSWVGMDNYINAWTNAGLKIDVILHFPPDWALRKAGELVPTNFELAWNDPNNGWGQYCFKFAERYGDRVASYEIWNEPDLDQYWQGTAEEYFYLMKTCYMAIKAADPNSTVLMAGLVLVVDRTFFQTVLRLATQDPQGAANNYFFDVANLHVYGDSTDIYTTSIAMRNTMSQYGLGHKDIWITETNIALAGHGRFPNADLLHVTEEEQAWFILQAAMNAHAAGVKRLMFFRLADDGMDESFGLVHQTGAPRPSYKALQLASNLLYDITSARREVRSGVNIAYFRRSDGTRVTALYSESGTAVNVQIEAGQQAAILISSAGGYSAINAQNGFFTVPLSPTRGRKINGITAVGGPVVFLVEQDSEVPTVSAQVEPVVGDNSKVLLQWTGYDGFTGIASYEVIVSVNDGPWESWQAGITDTQITFDVSGGGKYSFQVRAIDRSGNIGPFSEIVTTTLIPEGTLLLSITDLRGQAVPYARVTLTDGTLHDADANGLITITTAPGTVRVARIDGSGQGRLEPDQPFEIQLAETSTTTWMLEPFENLLRNGTFDFGMQGWAWTAPGDATSVQGPGEWGSVLQVRGRQRPWGLPAASFEVDVPQEWTGALMSFYYRTPQAGTRVRLRVITDVDQEVLWQTDQQIGVFERVWVDLRDYAGQHVMLRFEIVAAKHGQEGLAEIDNVIVGNVPVLGQP